MLALWPGADRMTAARIFLPDIAKRPPRARRTGSNADPPEVGRHRVRESARLMAAVVISTQETPAPGVAVDERMKPCVEPVERVLKTHG